MARIRVDPSRGERENESCELGMPPRSPLRRGSDLPSSPGRPRGPLDGRDGADLVPGRRRRRYSGGGGGGRIGIVLLLTLVAALGNVLLPPCMLGLHFT